ETRKGRSVVLESQGHFIIGRAEAQWRRGSTRLNQYILSSAALRLRARIFFTEDCNSNQGLTRKTHDMQNMNHRSNAFRATEIDETTKNSKRFSDSSENGQNSRVSPELDKLTT
ncbi:MAG TPA: hypothetical protein VMM56_03230, partial [Planctomycetaceae bacterium]|nr:hypothetical protein [Planctomycetaceae bacterium]